MFLKRVVSFYENGSKYIRFNFISILSLVQQGTIFLDLEEHFLQLIISSL